MKSLPQHLGIRKRFELLRKLGEGGMGSVYEALDRERDERIAVKIVSEGNATPLQRFKHEFRALTDLEHPNLVRLGELHEAEGEWFFTMELVPGTDLLSYVTDGAQRASMPLDALPQPGKPLYDEARLRVSFQQLAVGLRALHVTGKVHRDIKPSNTLAPLTVGS
jgi:serine/threonine protein kinase